MYQTKTNLMEGRGKCPCYLPPIHHCKIPRSRGRTTTNCERQKASLWKSIEVFVGIVQKWFLYDRTKYKINEFRKRKFCKIYSIPNNMITKKLLFKTITSVEMYRKQNFEVINLYTSWLIRLLLLLSVI